MSFFERQDLGRIYVIKMVLPDDTVVHKIGMTHSNRSTDRMLEILRSWFMKFRFVPYTELRLDMECQDAAKLESHIHQILRHNRFTPTHQVDGGTEMFVELDEVRVLHYLRAYEKSIYTRPPELTTEEVEVMRELLCQKN